MTGDVRRCHKCGCTDLAACVDRDGPCCWVDDNLCSACQALAEKATVGAHQAVAAAAELLRFSREGDTLVGARFETYVVEQLLDAAKLAMEIEGWDKDSSERGQAYAAVAAAIEGWA